MPGPHVTEDAGVAKSHDLGDLPEGQALIFPESVNLKSHLEGGRTDVTGVHG